jgi:putative DNA primase/helicase
MSGDIDTAGFLQKALGYALTGDTSLECFFILYGSSTRNGKSTLTETVANILGDYARTVQPQTLSRRSSDGAAPSPDIARLKGARFICTPEPEKGLELNASLVKQFTGGDTFAVRNLNENVFEFPPEFKIFFNTNHLPRTNDDTIFSSGRVKVIPFERHFTETEQDTGLKKYFRRSSNKSAVLNWLIDGYRLLTETGLGTPQRISDAIAAYRAEADIISSFLCEYSTESEGKRLPTAQLYGHYSRRAADNGYKPLNNRNFVGELRKRCEVRHDSRYGNIVVGRELSIGGDRKSVV